MSARPEFPELLPPDAPHAQRVLAPGWWVLPAAVLGVIGWVVLILMLI